MALGNKHINTVADKMRILYKNIFIFNDFTLIASDKNLDDTDGESLLISTTKDSPIKLHGAIKFTRISGFDDGRSNVFIYDSDSTVIVNELTGEIEVETKSILRIAGILRRSSIYIGVKCSNKTYYDILIQEKFTGELRLINNALSYGFKQLEDYNQLWFYIENNANKESPVSKFILN